MTGRSGTRSRSHFTPRSMRPMRSPATTRTWKRGGALPDGRAQPRVNSRCRSERIQSSTSSVIVLLAVLLGQALHRLNKRIVVRHFLDADGELHVRRAAARTCVPPYLVLERPLPPAGAAAKSGHRYSSEPGEGGEISISVSVSRSYRAWYMSGAPGLRRRMRTFSKPGATGTGSPAPWSAQRVATQPLWLYRRPSAPQISQVQAERATARSTASPIRSLVSSETSPSQSILSTPNFRLMRTN